MQGEAARAALGGALAAAVGMASAWGFSVDDALISGRVAHHLARGLGYRFNPDGPSVDCVTPLGWAHVLLPWAGEGAVAAVFGARMLGGALWLLAAAQLGRQSLGVCSGARRLGLWLCLAGSLPLSAWAVAGMETGLVLALAVGALSPGWIGALCAGLAAALRPELVPWAATLTFGQALAARTGGRRSAALLAVSLLPALAAFTLRASVFGRPVPLAVFAKPSDLEHGLRYAFGVIFLAGPAYLLFAGRPWRTLPRQCWAVAAAFGVHLVILVGVGGDWMPFWRLAVPVLPGVLLVGAALAERSSLPGNLARGCLVLGSAAVLHVYKGEAARGVDAQRARMMAELRPLVAEAARVASVDVGWVSAAAGARAHIVDLAGATDEEVAFLPGGHTSKRLPLDFLERRDVDALVLRRARVPDARPAAAPALSGSRWVYPVDRRVLSLRGADQFELAGTVALTPEEEYVVLRRRAPHLAR